MKSTISRMLFPVVICSALVGTGCETGDDDTTPTPTPVDEQYRVTALTVGETGEGVDVDGDGDIDNNVAPTLDALYVSIMSSVAAELGCDASTCTGDTLELYLAIDALVADLFSVETLNAALQVNSGFIVQLKGDAGSGDAECLWFDESTSYAVCTQDGALSSAGSGRFGPDDFPLTLQFGSSDAEGSFSLDLTLRHGITEVSSAFETPRVMTGGGLSLDDLLTWAGDVLDSVNLILPPAYDLDVQAILSQISAELTPVMDLDLSPAGAPDGVNDAFSIGLVATVDDTAVLD